MSQFLVAETTLLRPWAEVDLPLLLDMRNDVQLQYQLMARARGSSLEQVKIWAKRKSESADTFFWVVGTVETNEAIGYVQIVGVDSPNGVGKLGICIVPAFQQMGHGSRAIKLAEKYVREASEVRKLSLEVLSGNTRAIETYTKLCFEEAQLLKRHFLALDGDSYDDVLIMEKVLRR